MCRIKTNLKIGYIMPSSSFYRRDKDLPTLSSILKTVTGRSNFREIGIKDFLLSSIERLDVLIIPWGLIGNMDMVEKKAERLKSFVEKGGLCWIMHQNTSGWYAPVFPPRLKPIRIENKYEEMDAYFPEGRMKYVCPLILRRSHPLWNYPYFIDETDFLDWNITLLGKKKESASTHVVYVPDSWNILAGYADEATRVSDRAALVFEAGYGKGHYFWTQILPAECAFKKDGIERHTWEKLFCNALVYLETLKRSMVFEITLEPESWAVCSGDSVEILVKSQKKIKSIRWEIYSPTGKVEQIKRQSFLVYKPSEGGTYEIRAGAVAKDGTLARGRTFVKCTNGLTPFRYVIHTHFSTTYMPIHPAMLSAYARNQGIDAIFAAEGLFYGDKNMFCRLDDETLRLVDSPAVRFFHGEEIHHMHQYNKKEGAICPESDDTRRHAVTLGCESVYPYSPEFWQWKNLKRVHAKSGLVVAAHPGIQTWWMDHGGADDFEGFEFYGREGANWDKMLKSGRHPVGMFAHDIDPNCFNAVNIVWMDRSFSLENLLNGILQGRIVGVTTFGKFSRKGDNHFWFGINGLFPGGILYAADAVTLGVRAKTPFLFTQLCVCKNGDISHKISKINKKTFNLSLTDRLKCNSFYRIELKLKREEEERLFFSNPVFVKKIAGPPSGYFYFQNRAKRLFDKKQKRFVIPVTQVEQAIYTGKEWKVIFNEPGTECEWILGGVRIVKVVVDGNDITYFQKGHERVVISLGTGRHEAIIETG